MDDGNMMGGLAHSNQWMFIYSFHTMTQILATLEEMRFRGVRPDEFTYNTAIGAFAKVRSQDGSVSV